MKRFTLLNVALAWFNIGFAQLCIPNTSSLSFNGTSAYINISGQSLDITDSITVEAWIYPTQWGATSAQNTIFCKHGWSQGESGYVLRVGGTGHLSFNIGGIDTNGVNVSWVEDTTSGTPVLTLNTWQHVAGTYDGDTLRIYINGVLTKTRGFKGTIASSPYNPRIGALCDTQFGPDRYFQGNLDEVRVWHRPLPQSEIAANMNNHVDTSSAVGLAGYWRMNEGTGTTISDITGNGNTGTLLSTVWATNIPFNPIPPTPIITMVGGNLSVTTTLAIQWYFNGNIIVGADSNTYHATQNGAYTVIVTNAQGCTKLSPPYNLLNAGIAENQNQNGVYVYPNPAKGNDNITFSVAKTDKNLSLSITDLTGKTVLNLSTGNAKTDKIVLTKRTLTKGIYFYKLSGNHTNQVGKIVIN